MCVDAGVRAAKDLGFKVTGAHDAVANPPLSFNGVDVGAEQVKAAFLAPLKMLYAEVKSTEEVIGGM